MALRAGYYGIKSSVKKTLETLAADVAGMKIIKSFGESFNLTPAGKLNLLTASESRVGGVKVGNGLTMVDGVLSTSGGAFTITPLISGVISAAGEIIVSDDITNYDILEFVVRSTADGRTVAGHIAVSTFVSQFPYSTNVSDPNYDVQAYGGEYTRITAGQTNTTLNMLQLSSVTVVAINGLKL